MLFQLLVILCLYKDQLKGSWACILEGNAILGRAALPPYWQKCFKILWIREASYTFKLSLLFSPRHIYDELYEWDGSWS